MQSSYRLLACALALAAVAGCSRNDTSASATPAAPVAAAPTPTPARGALLQTPVQKMAGYSPNDLLGLLTGSSLGAILLSTAYTPQCTITVYHVEYQTVDPSGALTPASGALIVPSGSGACQGGRPIVEYAHGTSTDRSFNIAILSAAGNDEGLLLAAVFAGEGYIVIAPNYVGYDTSTLAYTPYLNADQNSKDMIDALAAARSALPTADAPATTDGGKLFVTGYSQGGYVAMATHRAMQAAGMVVTAAAPLSGPYALSAFGDAVFEGEVSASATVNLTLLASGYQHAYGNIYAATTDVFAPDFATGIDTLLPSTTAISILETEGKLPSNAVFDSTSPAPTFAAETPATMPAALATVFAAGFGPDFLVANAYRLAYLKDAQATPDGGFPALTDGLPPAAPTNTLRQAFKINDLRTWAPTAPVLLCAGNSDPTVFFVNTQLIEHYWAATAPAAAVSVLDIDSAVTADDPYAALKTEFAAEKAAVIANAVAGGATDGGAAAVLADYHAGLVSGPCLSAAKQFFDAH